VDALLFDTGLPRALAATQAGVNPHVISMWALRGWRDPDGTHRRLRVVGQDEHGHRLFHLGDILDAERATRHSPNSRRTR